jgi:phosphoribosylaminoimidazole (AIR) synthetase
MAEREYVKAGGVDSSKIGLFKDVMKDVSRRTKDFPLRRNCQLYASAYGGGFRYLGSTEWIAFETTEGLGNKNWISEYLYQQTGSTEHFHSTGGDTMLMAINDHIAAGATPTIYVDEVAAGDSDWFADTKRAIAIGESYFASCDEHSMWLAAGESPALRYLVKSEPPVKSAPILSGTVMGFFRSADHIVPDIVRVGDRIIGHHASGVHSNGISGIITRAMKLPDQFFTKLPNGNTLGEEVLIQTRSYAKLVKALQDNDVTVHRFLPGTGDGVAKLAAKADDVTYYIHTWPEFFTVFQFFLDQGMTMFDLLTTYNCNIGYYSIVPEREAERTIAIAIQAGYPSLEVGVVKEGPRGVVFGPQKDLWLPPPH